MYPWHGALPFSRGQLAVAGVRYSGPRSAKTMLVVYQSARSQARRNPGHRPWPSKIEPFVDGEDSMRNEAASVSISRITYWRISYCVYRCSRRGTLPGRYLLIVHGCRVSAIDRYITDTSMSMFASSRDGRPSVRGERRPVVAGVGTRTPVTLQRSVV